MSVTKDGAVEPDTQFRQVLANRLKRLQTPAACPIGEDPLADNLSQRLFVVTDDFKLALLIEIVQTIAPSVDPPGPLPIASVLPVGMDMQLHVVALGDHFPQLITDPLVILLQGRLAVCIVPQTDQIARIHKQGQLDSIAIDHLFKRREWTQHAMFHRADLVAKEEFVIEGNQQTHGHFWKRFRLIILV